MGDKDVEQLAGYLWARGINHATLSRLFRLNFVQLKALREKLEEIAAIR